jgi:transcriptional regulator with GAF, ATPase, and Fis domain
MSLNDGIKIWYSNVDGDLIVQDSVLSLIEDSGVDVYRCDIGSNECPGILFFNEFSTGLCGTIQKISNNGITRILAASTSNKSIMNSHIWKLLQAGAADVFSLKEERLVEKIVLQCVRWDRVDKLLSGPWVKNVLIGSSGEWLSVLRRIVEVAGFSESSILLIGESGTGKELLARTIHEIDPRKKKGDFVILDCSTIVPELSGSEFFGHERGAFTGAYASRDGAFARADNGTLFLDETGELPLELQAQLLRVIQEKTYKRIGGNMWFTTNFRLICATNRNLKQAVAEGRFRSDLFYRISTWTFELPPLSKRIDDILPLAKHFMREHLSDGRVPEIEAPVQELLLNKRYPGNIRDLKHFISRIMFRYSGLGAITAGDVPEEERPSDGEQPVASWKNGNLKQAIQHALLFNARLKEIRNEVDNIAINLAIQEENGNLQFAARRLGVSDRILQLRKAAERKQKQCEN